MRILILETNLLWSTRLQNAARTLGHEATVARKPVEGEFDVAIVNLGDAGVNWSELVAGLQSRGTKVVGHAGHKERELLELGRVAGCDKLATNSELANRLDRVLSDVSRVRRRVAITGGVAEGKSTVLSYLKETGIKTASADMIAKDVYASEPIQDWLKSDFGAAPTPENVRDRLASDPSFRRDLNSRTHPLIVSEMLSSSATAFEVPLLIEACLHFAFDEVWVVTCGAQIQHERLSARLRNRELAENLIRSQLSTRAKIPFADVVVRTNLDEETVRAYVAKVVTRI